MDGKKKEKYFREREMSWTKPKRDDRQRLLQ